LSNLEWEKKKRGKGFNKKCDLTDVMGVRGFNEMKALSSDPDETGQRRGLYPGHP